MLVAIFLKHKIESGILLNFTKESSFKVFFCDTFYFNHTFFKLNFFTIDFFVT